jgi:hypothetical protein
MIRFTGARTERTEIRDKYDLLLGIVATLEVSVESRLLYREEMFPIVELRVALERWLGSGLPAGDDFEFQSMESDEKGLVWLHKVDSAWRIGSIHQDFLAMVEFTDNEVSELVRSFIDEVDQWIFTHHHIRVSSLL